ncbi:MAG: chemotaxis protein CheW [Treponema sp.]|nr:chemotaxis protein CheW [Treponema sp.]
MTEIVTEGLPAEGPSEDKHLIFSIRDKYYALPFKVVSEVASLEKISPMPLTPNYVRGIVNRYSIPYALIDIGFILHNEVSNIEKAIVLKEEIDKLVFLIDDVTDIADILPENIHKIEHEENTIATSVNAFFNWNGNHVFCIDTEELIHKIKQDFDQEI